MARPAAPLGLGLALLAALVLSALPLPAAPATQAQGTRNGIVATLTDFGDDDYLAGALQGAILRAHPAGRVVSIGNQVRSFDVREGAYWLQQSARHYPTGTVVLAIVDPRIGTGAERKLVAETVDGTLFVGPDNGLLSLALADATVQRVYELSAPALMAPGALADAPGFGRDVYRIFAYAAGMLAAGAAPASAGPEVASWTRLTIRPPVLEQGVLQGEVMHADHFGNLTTNVGADLVQRAGLTLGQPLSVTVGDHRVTATFARTFGDVPANAYLAYVDEGALKIAINAASAAAALGARAGDAIAIAPAAR